VQVSSRFAPALQYNTLVGYGFVKYKPSDAGIPSVRGTKPAQEALTNTPISPAAVAEYQAYNDAQTRSVPEQPIKNVPIVISG
jgi:hypothetical protein